MTDFFQTSRVVVFLLLLSAAAASPVENQGSLRNSMPEKNDQPDNENENENQQRRQRRQRQLQTPTEAEVSPDWSEEEDYQTNYVHFNETMQDYLAEEFKELMRGSPSIEIITTFPEPPNQPRFWPLVKGMTIRNHLDPKILWATPHYLITDGLVTGCREPKPDGSTTVAIESALCDDHCIHAGRYCHPTDPANLPETVTGKSLVLEALRRLCMDAYYHASDYKWFRYLENFERAGCLMAADMTACSLEVMDKIGWLEYSNLEGCVGDMNDLGTDVINPKLEEQLLAIRTLGLSADDISNVPILHIGGVLYRREPTTKAIFEKYCSIFDDTGKMQPVSCDICLPCEDVRKCLWTLECDGIPFDDAPFLTAHGSGGPVTPTPTDPPIVSTDPPGEILDIPIATLPPGGISNSESAAATGDGASSNSNKFQNDDESGTNNQDVLVFFSIALCASAMVAGMIVLRDRSNRQRMADIAASQAHMEGTFHDTPIDNPEYHDNDIRSSYAGGSVSGYSDNNGDGVELSPARGNSAPPPTGAFLNEIS